MNIKETKRNAEKIIEECERVETLEKILKELETKEPTSVKFYYYFSQGYSDNIDVSIHQDTISKEVLLEIKEFVIQKIKEQLVNNYQYNK